MNSDAKSIAELIKLVTAIETNQLTLDTRRSQLMQFLKDRINAQNGFWGWGRGMPLDSSIAPVAVIPVGYTQEQWKALQSIALSEFTLRTFNLPIRELCRTDRMSPFPEVNFGRTNSGTQTLRWQPTCIRSV